MKNKFTIRKEIKTGLALVCLFFLIAFTERNQGGVLCTNVIVDLVNIGDNHFLDELDVNHIVESSDQKLKGSVLGRINFRAIEEKLKLDRHIRDAELYGDLKGNLIVRVELRRPIARIVQSDGPDAYLSEEGVVMTVSEKFSSRVMILSGKYAKRLTEMGDLTKTEEGRDLLKMIEFIHANSFWNAQIAQMDINSKGEITIYPQVTGQIVDFGTPENFEIKLRKLMVFYKEILPQKGWTKYERVNLKYEGQVIAQ